MLEIPPAITFYCMIVAFFLFATILSKVILQPTQAVLAERAKRTSGALAEASRMQAEARALKDELAAALDKARHAGSAAGEQIRRDAEATERRLLDEARAAGGTHPRRRPPARRARVGGSPRQPERAGELAGPARGREDPRPRGGGVMMRSKRARTLLALRHSSSPARWSPPLGRPRSTRRPRGRLTLLAMVNFTLYAFVMYRFAWPPIVKYLKERRATVVAALEAAARAHAEAEALKAEFEAKLKNVEADAARARDELMEIARTEADHLLEQAKRSAERIRRDAQLVADQEIARARRLLQEEASQLIANDRRRDRLPAAHAAGSDALRPELPHRDAHRRRGRDRRQALRSRLVTGAIAKRYARALASVAAEQSRLEQTAAELDRVAAWVDDPDLKAAFESPNLGAHARGAVWSDVWRSHSSSRS